MNQRYGFAVAGIRGDYDVIGGPSGETVPARPGDALGAGFTTKASIWNRNSAVPCKGFSQWLYRLKVNGREGGPEMAISTEIDAALDVPITPKFIGYPMNPPLARTSLEASGRILRALWFDGHKT